MLIDDKLASVDVTAVPASAKVLQILNTLNLMPDKIAFGYIFMSKLYCSGDANFSGGFLGESGPDFSFKKRCIEVKQFFKCTLVCWETTHCFIFITGFVIFQHKGILTCVISAHVI